MNLKPIQSDDTRIWGPLFLKNDESDDTGEFVYISIFHS